MSDAAELVYRQLERDRAVVARALDGHLTAAYQPIVDIARNVVVGYEALLRYRTDHDLIAPAFSAPELLASARRIGRIAEVESAALREALQVRDDLPHDCFLSLNVSVAALTDDRATELLRSQGALHGVVLELSHDDAPRSRSWSSESGGDTADEIAILIAKPAAGPGHRSPLPHGLPDIDRGSRSGGPQQCCSSHRAGLRAHRGRARHAASDEGDRGRVRSARDRTARTAGAPAQDRPARREHVIDDRRRAHGSARRSAGGDAPTHCFALRAARLRRRVRRMRRRPAHRSAHRRARS